MTTVKTITTALALLVPLLACAPDSDSEYMDESTELAPSDEDELPSAEGDIREVETEHGIVRYEVIDGEAVIDGDMIMGSPEEFEARLQQGNMSPRGVGIDLGKWADMPVKYSFSSSVPSAMEDDIELALERLIEQSNAQISFQECTGLCLGAHLKFKYDPDGECKAHVGWAPVAKVHLASYCDGQNANATYDHEIGVIMHEVMHALGVYHEQSRCDRDQFVTIHENAIKAGKAHNFTKHCWNASDYGDYDFGSIMHYSRTAHAINNANPTISAVNPNNNGSPAVLTSCSATICAIIASVKRLCGGRVPPPFQAPDAREGPERTEKRSLREIHEFASYAETCSRCSQRSRLNAVRQRLERPSLAVAPGAWSRTP